MCQPVEPDLVASDYAASPALENAVPILSSVDHDRQVVIAEAVGELTYDDLVRHLETERLAGGIPYREVIDATRATAGFSAAEARALVDVVRRLAERGAFGPTAVIVADDVTYGMTRMLEILLEDVCDVRPFRATEREAASRWVASRPIRGRQ